MSFEDVSEYEELPPPSERFAAVILALSTLSINDLVRQFREVRDALSDERKRFKQFEADSKDLMARISMVLRDKADDLGVDSFSTPSGTAYRQIKESYRVGDWPAVLAFIRETGYFQMLEKRVGKNATKEIHELIGEVPPGVNYSMEVVFAVRKPAKGK